MRNAKQFRQAAWDTLRNRYWRSVLAALIVAVLGAFAVSGTVNFTYSFDRHDLDQLQATLAEATNDLPATIENAYRTLSQTGILYTLTVLVCAVLAVSLSCGVARYLVGAPSILGHDLFCISLFRSADKPAFDILFSRFSIFGRAVLLRFLMGLKTFLWSLLLFVPGIIAAYRYAMAPYLLAEHPEWTASEAIDRSKELMRGNKWRLFCLNISFIGWYLLAGLTGGLGFVFLNPYTTAANAAFYLELTGQLPLTASANATSAPAAPIGETPASGDDPELI